MKIELKKTKYIDVKATVSGRIYGLPNGGFVYRIDDPNRLISGQHAVFVNFDTGVLHTRSSTDQVIDLDVDTVILA